MALSKQQKKEISEQKSQKYSTKRVTSPELEKILYDAIQYAEKNKIKFNFNDVPELILENGSNPYVFKGSNII